jgi:hypothetical protein
MCSFLDHVCLLTLHLVTGHVSDVPVGLLELPRELAAVRADRVRVGALPLDAPLNGVFRRIS